MTDFKTGTSSLGVSSSCLFEFSHAEENSKKYDDDTSRHLLNLSNYNKNESPEAPHFAWILLEEKKA
jgi:hypothetical protein